MTGTAKRITALVVQQRNRYRANVYLDGEFAFGLSDILAAELRVGQELSAEDVEALQQRDTLEVAYNRALNFLSFRPRSEQEMRQYLEKRGLEAPAIDAVLARLRRAGFLDDRAFARYWVENREAHRPRGRWALGVELRRKGIEDEIIEAASSDVDEEASAMRAAREVLHRYAALDRETFFRRMLGRLQRRGFGYGVARRVVETLWNEAQQG